jgi:signal transduction histidine kinase/CheY-like chemotaxis protein
LSFLRYAPSIAVTAFAAVAVSVLVWFGLAVSDRFENIDTSWQTYSADASKASAALDGLYSAIGYGGLIHNFKNYVLRRDARSLERLEGDFARARGDLATLKRSLQGREEHRAVDAISDALAEYESKFRLQLLAGKGLSSQELDRLVRVDDTAALAALGELSASLKARSANQAHLMSNTLAKSKIFLRNGLFVIVLIVVAAVAIVVYQVKLLNARSQMEAAVERANEANNAKSEFLSSMSHELRTPLNAIIGFAQLMELDRRQPLSDIHLDYAHHIGKSGDHLLSLIKDVLDLAKIETGNTPLSIETVVIEDCIENCLALIKPMADSRDVKIVLYGPKGARNAVLADMMRLKQVLLIFLTNAIKYGGNGADVSIGWQPAPGNRFRISVTDNGAGIPADRHDELFQPFSRLDAKNSGIEGTGIGLTIARRLIESMEGTIGLDSVEGQGSTFWIELPRGTATEEAETVGNVEMPRMALAANASGKVLYVEDNPTNMILMESLIARIDGVDLVTAPTGEIGIEIAKAETPALIILDIDLPGINGIEALRQLQSMDQFGSTPIIALTAAARELDIRRGIEACFKHYMTKPVDILEFTDILEKEIGAKQVS